MTVRTAAVGALASGSIDAAATAGMATDGDESQLRALLSVLVPGDQSFNIIEP